MKKTLIAICVTFLLAAPIQMVSATATTTSEGKIINQTSKYTTFQY